MSGQMETLVQFGHQPHPMDRKKYGRPYIAVYWANARFVQSGLWVGFQWPGKWVQLRVIPWRYRRSGY